MIKQDFIHFAEQVFHLSSIKNAAIFSRTLVIDEICIKLQYLQTMQC